MRILLTNDDGIEAPGIAALHDAVAPLGEVHVVAPSRVQSATSHAVTFHREMRVVGHRGPVGGGGHPFEGVAVDGRPADCVKLGVRELVPAPVDLVISGINAGANIGINVIYSGTVGAAREAAFLGIPAIAVSLHLAGRDAVRWADAARHARGVIERLIAGPMQSDTVMNVNIPVLDDDPEVRGVRVVPMSTSPMVDEYEHRAEAAGDRAYRVSSAMTFSRHDPGSDVEALFERYITVTPLHHDLTFHERLAGWESHLA